MDFNGPTENIFRAAQVTIAPTSRTTRKISPKATILATSGFRIVEDSLSPRSRKNRKESPERYKLSLILTREVAAMALSPLDILR